MWIKRFNEAYMGMLNLLSNFNDLALTFIRTLIVTIGIPIALCFIIYVEQDRIRKGVLFFESGNVELAALAAWVLVILNVVLEFLIVYEEDKTGHVRERVAKFSIMVLWERMAYLFGQRGIEYRSTATRYQKTLSVVTFTILALALLGSMESQMRTVEGAWHVAIGKILTESSLAELMEWLGGLLFAFTLIISAQALSNYVALHTTQIIRDMMAKTSAGQRHSEIEIERPQYDALPAPDEDMYPLIHEDGLTEVVEGSFEVVCPDCGWRHQADSIMVARMARNNHKDTCC